MNEVYLLWDSDSMEMVGVYSNYPAARDALVEYLENESGYSSSEWEEFANAAGYDTVDEFKQALREMPDYDEDMMMEIAKEEVHG